MTCPAMMLLSIIAVHVLLHSQATNQFSGMCGVMSAPVGCCDIQATVRR
jgi:hypothetical protein